MVAFAAGLRNRHGRTARDTIYAADPAEILQGTPMAFPSAQALGDQSRRRLTIGFNNFAHAVDHYVMLIFPTVVIGLELVYGRPYAELLALGTASFFAFGIFSLPAG